MDMAKKTKKAKEKNAMKDSVCSNCWRYSAFKEKCMYFWENKSECSKFMNHQFDEERYVKKSILD